MDIELKATQEVRNAVDILLAEIERLRKQLIDWDSIKQTLQDLIARSDILSGVAKNWRHGTEIAGMEFIRASDRISKGMLESNLNFASTYLDWWKCTGQAYVAIPVQYGQAVCTIENFMKNLMRKLPRSFIGFCLLPLTKSMLNT